VSAVVRLRLALAREEAATGSAAGVGARAADRLRGRTERQLREPNAVIFLALASQREIGILRCADPDSHEPGNRSALVTTAFVARSHRRRGVLRALLRRAEAWSLARGVTSLRLRVGAGNAAGQAAWSSLGFETHAILMSRPITRG
jgi:GNAT superfamily N-acetyltransferase